ncbi:MAG: peptide deformylase [Calditrichota bacterium]
MAVLPVIKLGHSSLRKQAEEITVFDDELRTLVDNMVETMRLNDGIGLAGPQVNILKRIFVIDLHVLDETLQAKAYINPEIVESEGSEKMEEGCLSIPFVRADVSRPNILTVRYQDIDGNQHEEKMDELLARVFQHELDHLNGVMFIDHLSLIQRKLLEPKLKRIREENSLS